MRDFEHILRHVARIIVASVRDVSTTIQQHISALMLAKQEQNHAAIFGYCVALCHVKVLSLTTAGNLDYRAAILDFMLDAIYDEQITEDDRKIYLVLALERLICLQHNNYKFLLGYIAANKSYHEFKREIYAAILVATNIDLQKFAKNFDIAQPLEPKFELLRLLTLAVVSDSVDLPESKADFFNKLDKCAALCCSNYAAHVPISIASPSVSQHLLMLMPYISEQQFKEIFIAEFMLGNAYYESILNNVGILRYNPPRWLGISNNLSAQDNLDFKMSRVIGIELASNIRLAFFSKDHMQLAKYINELYQYTSMLYVKRNIALLSLLIGFSSERLQEFLVILESKNNSLARLYLFLNIVHIFNENIFLNCDVNANSEVIKEVSGYFGLDMFDLPRFSGDTYTAIAWATYMNLAVITANHLVIAELLRNQAQFYKEALSSDTTPLNVNELFTLQPKHLSELIKAIRAKNDAELYLCLIKVYNSMRPFCWINLNLKIEIAMHAAIFKKLNIPDSQFLLVELYNLPEVSKRDFSTLATAIYAFVNSGININEYGDLVEMACKSSGLLAALPVPNDSDSDNYKLVYKIGQRILADTFLSHRFGISGKNCYEGFSYDLDGSVDFSMLHDLSRSFNNFVAMPDMLGTEVYFHNCDEKVRFQLVKRIKDAIDESQEPCSDVPDIESKSDWIFASVVLTFNISANGVPCNGHASGLVFFKWKDEYYCAISDRSMSPGTELAAQNEVNLQCLDRLGINVFKVGNVGYISNVIKTLKEKGPIGIERCYWNNMQTNLSLELQYCVVKKYQKSGNCGYSSGAKGLLYSVTFAVLLQHYDNLATAEYCSNVFTKFFSSFDRRFILDDYNERAKKYGFEVNSRLLARIAAKTSQKATYQPAFRWLQRNYVAVTENLDVAKSEMREAAKSFIILAANMKECEQVAASDIDQYAREYVELELRHASRAEMNEFLRHTGSKLRAKYL